MKAQDTRLHPFSQGASISLSQVLDARERRAHMQKALLQSLWDSSYVLPASGQQFQKPVCLISFTLNIVGPVKVFPYTIWTYRTGIRQIQDTLDEMRFCVIRFEQIEESAGYEGFFLVNADPKKCKEILTRLEETHPLGRLFDIDVLRPDGSKVSREELHIPGRTCLLCDNPAFLCGRSRTHSAYELLDKEISLMEDFFLESASAHMGKLMKKALIMEVDTTLKPGLVDKVHNGSHRDMEHQTFIDSACALEDYFTEAGKIGIRFGLKYSEEYKKGKAEIMPALFDSLRPLGIEAENTMRAATKGVNTHKGILFSGGILCGALGFYLTTLEFPKSHGLRGEDSRHALEALPDIIRSMLVHILDDYGLLKNREPRSHGEVLYARYGITGVRGEAGQGFPTLFSRGYPLFLTLLSRGHTKNDAGLITLLHYIGWTEDTNMISRSDCPTARNIRDFVNAYLEKSSPEEQLSILPGLDSYFVSKNISPGGSADMLALTYFLYLLFL